MVIKNLYLSVEMSKKTNKLYILYGTYDKRFSL